MITNGGADGGFQVFHRNEESDTFATSLQARQYDTAMMGKYLNGYTPRGQVDGSPRYVPPGWSAWSVAGNGYPEFNYNLLQKTVGGQPQVVHHGNPPQDYLTDVISRRGQDFIGASVSAATRSCSSWPPSPRTAPSPRPRATPTASRTPGSRAPGSSTAPRPSRARPG